MNCYGVFIFNISIYCFIYLLSYKFELEKLNELLWICFLYIVGNLLKDFICVLYLFF